MSDFDYGPLKTYEITWPSNQMLDAFVAVQTTSAKIIRMHGMIDGRWTLQLQAREEDIRTIRNVTTSEPVPGGEVA
jgi:hypothetical protein